MKSQSKVLFITNYPSPYRVDFWNLLGQSVDLTVSFTSSPKDQTHRSSKWFNLNYDHFRPVFLENKRRFFGKTIFTDIVPLIKEGWNCIILGGYSSFTAMYAIEYMRLHRISFWLEADGGLISKDSLLIYLVKKHFVSAASWWFSSGKTTSEYFKHYGADEDKIFEYPFTSLTEEDLRQAEIKSRSDKKSMRKKLNIAEDKVVLSVGRFSYNRGYGKGYDVLLRSAESFDKSIGVYIVGDEPTEEFVNWKQEKQLTNVHFVGFKTKTELAEYYIAADVLAMPTRGDVWGLVVNEALSYGLPVVSSDKCVAALDFIKNEYNGYIVPVEDSDALTEGISKVLAGDYDSMSSAALQSVRDYTIENMAKRHLEVIEQFKD